MKEDKVKVTIVMGNVNQYAEDIQMLHFLNTNGLLNVHQQINSISSKELDYTFIRGSKCISIVLCVCRLIECIAGYQMVECDEVAFNDYCGYLVHIEIERCCQCKLSKHNKPRHTVLDNAKKSHVKKINNEINDLMDQMNMRQRTIELQHVHNKVDELITKVLNKARSAVEGPIRSIPWS